MSAGHPAAALPVLGAPGHCTRIVQAALTLPWRAQDALKLRGDQVQAILLLRGQFWEQ